MKSERTAQIGIMDALTSGLRRAAQRPWLLIIPAAVDYYLWLGPQFSIARLIQQFLVLWDSLMQAAYSPTQLASMKDMLTATRDLLTQVGAQVNLADAITGNWLAAPSAIALAQSTRLMFVSDMVLAPMGLSMELPRIAPPPWQAAPIELGSWWAVLAVVGIFWLVGQVLVVLYLRWASFSWPVRGQEGRGRTGAGPGQAETPTSGEPGVHPAVPEEKGGVKRWLVLALRLSAFSVILSLVVFVLRIPLALAATLMMAYGNAVVGVLLALVGGVTLWLLLWFLTSLFFVCEAILLNRQALWHGVGHSMALVRSSSLRTVGLVLIINVLMLGFRALWGLVGQSPVGGGLAILANAYLATGMLLGVFAYYEDIRARWLVRVAQAARQQKSLHKD